MSDDDNAADPGPSSSYTPVLPQVRTRRKVRAVDVLAAINPSPSRRLAVVLCFPLVFLLAVPFWYYTTSIERLPLPVDRIAALELARDTEVRTQILFTADDKVFPSPPPGKAVFTTRTKLEALGKEVVSGVDGINAKKRPAERGRRRWELVYEEKRRATPLRVHLHLDDRANVSFPLEPYVQAPYDGAGDSSMVPPGTLVIPVHPTQVSDRNLKHHYKIALINGIHNLIPPHLPGIPTRALAYSPNITLSFVLLNEDAAAGSHVTGWDIETAIQDHFMPHLEPLKPVFNFSIESQVLYHAPLTFEPIRRYQVGSNDRGGDADESTVTNAADVDAWLIGDEEMKMFVSERWSLDSGSTNNPVLRFLLFVPSAQHRPMRLAVNEAVNSFLIPQFGSVVLVNPPKTGDSADTVYHLRQDALDPAFTQFTHHLYSLLALPPLPSQLHPSPDSWPSRSDRGMPDPLTPWQLDTVLRMRHAENAAEARKTLAGIVRLVEKIEEMKVGQGVRGCVLGAVQRLEGLPAAAMSNSPLLAFTLSRDAVALANEAFFDPSMMGLLYFPDQHKFAVYTPLFAPVAVSLLVGGIREIMSYLRRRRARRAAATAALAAAQQSGSAMATVNEATTEGEIPSQANPEGENAPVPISARTTRRRVAASISSTTQ